MANKRDTQHGFSDPDAPERIKDAPVQGAPKSRAGGTPFDDDDRTLIERPAAAPPFDVDVTRQVGAPGLLDGPWIAVELWTQNRIYGLSGSLVCVSVSDRLTGADSPEHATIGARLAGGQRRNATGLITEVSHPLPEVGSAAVFVTGLGKRLRVSETSTVIRVLMRQRIVKVGPNGELPTWDEITDSGAHKVTDLSS